MNLTVVKDGSVRQWDARADKIARNAHNSGKELMDIAREMNKSGYAVTKAEVAGSLQRQGIQNIRWGAEWMPKLPWDANAQSFAQVSLNAGKSLDMIVDDLRANGYGVNRGDILANMDIHKSLKLKAERKGYKLPSIKDH